MDSRVIPASTDCTDLGVSEKVCDSVVSAFARLVVSMESTFLVSSVKAG